MNHTKRSKNYPPVSPATLHANPQYAHVCLPSGVETTVNICDIAPHPDTSEEINNPSNNTKEPSAISVQRHNSNSDIQ